MIARSSRTAPIRTPAEAEPIAEANIGLLYGAVYQFRRLWPNGDEDEAVGIASIAFWRACLAHDPGQGTIGTLVYRSVFNALTRASRDAGAAKRRGAALVAEPGQHNTPVAYPADPPDAEPWWLRLLTEEDRQIIRLLAEGLTHAAISEAMGFSRTHVYHRLLEIRAVLADAGVSAAYVPPRPSHWHNLSPRRARRRAAIPEAKQ